MAQTAPATEGGLPAGAPEAAATPARLLPAHGRFPWPPRSPGNVLCNHPCLGMMRWPVCACRCWRFWVGAMCCSIPEKVANGWNASFLKRKSASYLKPGISSPVRPKRFCNSCWPEYLCRALHISTDSARRTYAIAATISASLATVFIFRAVPRLSQGMRRRVLAMPSG